MLPGLFKIIRQQFFGSFNLVITHLYHLCIIKTYPGADFQGSEPVVPDEIRNTFGIKNTF